MYFSPHRRISEILRHNKFIYFALQNIVPAAYKYHFVHELAKLNHLHSVLNRCFILDNIMNIAGTRHALVGTEAKVAPQQVIITLLIL